MDAATKSPEPSFSATESEGSQEAVETAKPKKSSDAADVDAVAMLLGLSQHEGSDEGAAGGQRGAARAKRPLPGSIVAVADLPGVTKKGASRLGPGDNRVRPPKAATKLLPEAKWRHIRLPDVQTALEAEDLVVLWAHYKHPEQLPRAKAESHLNFIPSHYDECELRQLLEPVNTAFELEDLLKERFGVGSHSKKLRTGGPAGNGSASPGAPLSPTADQSDDDAAAPAASSLPRQSSHELAGLLYIGAGLKDGAKHAQQAAGAVKSAEGGGAAAGAEAMDTEEAAAENAEEGGALGGEEEETAGEGDDGRENVDEQPPKPAVDADQLDATAAEPVSATANAAAAVVEAAVGVAAAGVTPAAVPAAAGASIVVEDELKSQVAAVAVAQQAQELKQLQQLQQQQLQLQQQHAQVQAAAALAAVPLLAATDAAAAGTAAAAAPPAMPAFDPAQFLAQQQPLTTAGLDAAFMQQQSEALAALAAGAGADGLAGLDPSALLAAAASGSLQLPGGIPGLAGGFSFGPNGIGSLMPGFALFGNPLQWPINPRGYPGLMGAAPQQGGAAQNGENASNGGGMAGGGAPNLSSILPPNFQMPPGLSGNPAAGLESLGFAPPGLTGAAGGGNASQGGIGGGSQADGGRGGVAGGSSGPATKFAAGDRPGRPPSYDEMVRWCVDLKRCLWQRHVPLTIEEAVAMVNDPAHFTSGGCRTIGGKARVLVASTLRKRVLGIFKITWSQVATDADPSANEETPDTSVLGAAAAKLKRQGMDPGRSAHGSGGRGGNAAAAAAAAGNNSNNVVSAAAAAAMQHAAAAAAMAQMPHGMMGGGGNPTMMMAQAQHDNAAAAAMAAAFAIPPAALPGALGAAGFPGLLPANAPGLPPATMAHQAQQAAAFRADAGFPIPLSTVALTLPQQLRDMVDRGQVNFLSTEEVCVLLVKAAENGLPVSTKPAIRPPPGSMFLYDKNATPRFRCDGYEWKRRETHAKRKFGEETKLNCYYVGGPGDEVQRRCYWLLDESVSSLVLVHYQPPPVEKSGDGGSVSDEEEEEEGDGVGGSIGIGGGGEGGGSGEGAGGGMQQQQQRAAMPPASMDLHNGVAIEVREIVEPGHSLGGGPLQFGSEAAMAAAKPPVPGSKTEPGLLQPYQAMLQAQALGAVGGSTAQQAKQAAEGADPRGWLPQAITDSGFHVDAARMMAGGIAGGGGGGGGGLTSGGLQKAGGGRVVVGGQLPAVPARKVAAVAHHAQQQAAAAAAATAATATPSAAPWEAADAVAVGGEGGKSLLRERFAAMDVSDSSMFSAMCALHHVEGISKQDRAGVCRLWMENVLDDNQKKQLFTYIKENIEDEEAVAEWVKGVIKKNTPAGTSAGPEGAAGQ